MKIRISKLALGDLDAIHAYTVAHWGDAQAERYVDEIWQTFERIVARPERWRLRDDVHPGCRICYSGSHAVLYRIRGGRVEIARVLHGSMDFQRHVPPGFFADE
ncbi:MAG: type II toxin-antitoxin system RelE/ParE family toxin [Verrucomicrobiota bacterium]